MANIFQKGKNALLNLADKAYAAYRPVQQALTTLQGYKAIDNAIKQRVTQPIAQAAKRVVSNIDTNVSAGIPAAGQIISNHTQPIQRYFAPTTPQPRARDYTRELAINGGQFAKGLAQDIPRLLTGALLTNRNQDTFVPRSNLQRAVLGNDPVKSFAANDANLFLRKHGLNPNQAKNTSALLAAGSLASNFIGGEGKVAEESVKALDAAKVASKEIPFFNAARMGVDDTVKKTVQKTIEELAPKINELTGKPLTFKEVRSGAKMATELSATMTREDAANIGAQSLALRQRVAELAQMGATDDQYKEALIKDKAFGQYIARLLGQRRIVSDPAQKSLFNEMISKILKTGIDPDKLYTEAKGINFEDTKQATAFYRKYVKTTPSDWLDLLRYNSMLSSPATHFSNIASNAQGTGVLAPIEKTVTGAVDFLGSKITNKPQQQFAGEGPAYAKGYYSNIKTAAQRFSNVMSGTDLSTNPDVRNIPLATGGIPSKVEGALSVPMKLLEGMDQFFSALTEGGSRSAFNYRAGKGVKVGNVDEKVGTEAAYRLFRGDVGAAGQNPILRVFDTLTQSVDGLRNSSDPIVRTISKFTIPFLKTPTNILKQGVEYSPLGLSTVLGSGNPQEQLAKSIIGASTAAGISTLLGSNRLTWAEPVNPNQKAAFRAAGLQPYSVKVGDKWYSYTKMHPVIAMNMAFISAIDDAQKQRKLSESDADTLLNGFAKVMNFYADASYAKNIGDFVSGLKGSPEGAARLVSNYPSQVIPFRALLSYINRAIDPVQRQADPDASQFTQTLQNIMAQVPGLSQKVSPRLGPNGQPIENQNRLLNAIVPLAGIGRVTNENPEGKAAYDTIQALSQVRRDNKAIASQEKQRIDQYIKTGNTELIQGIDSTKVRTQIKKAQKDEKTKSLSPRDAVIQGATKKEQQQLKEKGYQADYRSIDPLALATGASKASAADKKYNSAADPALASAQFSQDLARAKSSKAATPEIVDLYKNRIDDLSSYMRSLDPEVDKTKITQLETKIEKMTNDVQKYNTQGGFTKAKSGKKPITVASGKSVSAATYKSAKTDEANQTAQFSLKSDTFKRSKDAKGYLNLLKDRYTELENSKDYAKTDAQVTSIENKQADLVAEGQKIVDQGGFTKTATPKKVTIAKIDKPNIKAPTVKVAPTKALTKNTVKLSLPSIVKGKNGRKSTKAIRVTR